ncbi:MAG TPA: hypothetical protein VGW57_13665 [Chthoniobacterales bacterium]|nr:hypothetical protein [Chthoniobacterales bacterium]
MLKGIYLSLLVGPVVPAPMPRVVIEALTSVTVTSATKQASGFELTFTLNNQSPLYPIFVLGAVKTPLLRVLLIVTVNGIPQVLMDGVTTLTQITPGSSGESTLTVTGKDLTKLMASNLIDLNGMPYPAMPAEARVALIIAKYAVFGMIPLVIPSLSIDVPIPTERIPRQEGNDLEYVQGLASDAGYVFYIDCGPVPGTNLAYWGPEIKVGPPQPALNLDMDAHTNVESLTFSCQTSESVLPIVFIQNALTKAPIPIPIPKINPLQPPLGVTGFIPTRVEVLRDTAKLSPMAALSRGLAAGSAASDSVTGSGTLDVLRYGRLLKSRQLVGVRGAGMAYDGLYFVESVTTTIKRGEIKQNFSLTRNGLISITPKVPV